MNKKNDLTKQSENKQDLRVLKTEYLIKQSFLNLLKTKQYSKISITDIVKKAMINRNTFYLHYTDKEDLLNSLIDEYFDKYSEIASPGFQSVRLGKAQLQPVVYEFLRQVEKEMTIFRLLISDTDMSGYLIKVKNRVRNQYKGRFINDPVINFKLEYLFEGIFGLFFKWVDGSLSTYTTKELSKYVTDIITETLTSF